MCIPGCGIYLSNFASQDITSSVQYALLNDLKTDIHVDVSPSRFALPATDSPCVSPKKLKTRQWEALYTGHTNRASACMYRFQRTLPFRSQNIPRFELLTR
ncbi:hypothetical protein QCA50_015323 [Cerrena zonata]|uniref:Uncharacterized protein n=1 Tax=Cerrena zonata TaxID=2478898 RepID=A0AAW0FRN9_9APHY